MKPLRTPADKARIADRKFFARNPHRLSYVRRQFPGEFDGFERYMEDPRATPGAGQASFCVVQRFGEDRALIPCIGPVEYTDEDVGEENAAALFFYMLAETKGVMNLVHVEEDI